MSQSDFIIENQSGAQFRLDVQSALRAAVSCSIGRAAPTTTYAGQLWFDSQENELKVRNEGNNAWIVFADTNSVLNHIRLRTSVLRAVDRRGITLEALNGADLLRVAENGDVSGAAIATAAEIAAGTAGDKLLKVGDLPTAWDYESPPTLIPRTTSAYYSIGTGQDRRRYINTIRSSLSFLHGLSATPKQIQIDIGTYCNIPNYIFTTTGRDRHLDDPVGITYSYNQSGISVLFGRHIQLFLSSGGAMNATLAGLPMIVRASL